MEELPKKKAPEQSDLEPIVTVEGVVERIVFENEENGFFVARLQEKGNPDLVTFVGEIMAISPGETVRLRGRWIDDKRFGKQLRVVGYETILPSTVAGIEKYLGSGLIEGIGPAYAKRLVDAFGIETLRVIDEQPERLRGVEGIGKKRAGQIREAWASQKAIQSIMIFLQSHGISTAQAVKIYKAYGDKAVAVLRENPYRLAEDISGIAFRGADKIARDMGIAANAVVRLEAGILHTLRRAATEGHVYLPEVKLLGLAEELLEAEVKDVTLALRGLVMARDVIAEQEAVYLPNLHRAENTCAERLKKLMGIPLEKLEIHLENALKWVEKTKQIELSEEQKEAVRKGVQSKVLIITGGPGTGKTTVINSLLGILEKKGLSFLLAAPTGRAAKRMEEATGHVASTIHRLLEFSPQQGGFSRNANNPLHTDLLVVDEASMIDVSLMSSLLQAMPPFGRLVLVGDIDQLPSVGPGNVLLDLIASGVLPVVRLKTVFRQAAESGIISNAHRINQGQRPAFNETDFFLIERNETEKLLETVVELVTRRIPRKFKLNPLRDVQVMSPVHKGEAGVARLNEGLQQALNPHGLAVPKRNFRQGDKVMQLRNNYELEVFNGDMGIITRVDLEDRELEVSFDDRPVIYRFEELDNLGLAYAITVHKSQGSEYPAVVLVMMPQHYMMLQRNLLYTAITRGKNLVIVVGSHKAVATATRNSKFAERNTKLAERLRNSLKKTKVDN